MVGGSAMEQAHGLRDLLRVDGCPGRLCVDGLKNWSALQSVRCVDREVAAVVERAECGVRELV